MAFCKPPLQIMYEFYAYQNHVEELVYCPEKRQWSFNMPSVHKLMVVCRELLHHVVSVLEIEVSLFATFLALLEDFAVSGCPLPWPPVFFLSSLQHSLSLGPKLQITV